MPVEKLLEKIRSQPDNIEFDEVIAAIDANFDYTPTAFRNGDTENPAGSNEGSCKIFAFARLSGLSENETLHCFGKYYRDDVLANPGGDDHANIRNFMQHGWNGISFNTTALAPKT